MKNFSIMCIVLSFCCACLSLSFYFITNDIIVLMIGFALCLFTSTMANLFTALSLKSEEEIGKEERDRDEQIDRLWQRIDNVHDQSFDDNAKLRDIIYSEIDRISCDMKLNNKTCRSK